MSNIGFSVDEKEWIEIGKTVRQDNLRSFTPAIHFFHPGGHVAYLHRNCVTTVSPSRVPSPDRTQTNGHFAFVGR